MNFFSSKPVVEIDPKLKQEQVRNEIGPEISDLLSTEDCDRFLRARNYDVPKTVEMIKKWDEWWKTHLPPTTEEKMTPAEILIKQEIDSKEHVYQQHLPHANWGEDKEGRPVYWEKTGLISSRFQEIKKHLSEDELFIRHVRQQELMIERLKHNSAKHNKVIEKQIIIFDLANLSYSLDFVALNTFKRTVQIDEMAYPERLQTLYMINTPIFFSTIWAMIKVWINPVTASKIQMIGSKYQDKLKEIINEDQIPVEYGGTKQDFPWQWPHNHDLGKLRVEESDLESWSAKHNSAKHNNSSSTKSTAEETATADETDSFGVSEANTAAATIADSVTASALAGEIIESVVTAATTDAATHAAISATTIADGTDTAEAACEIIETVVTAATKENILNTTQEPASANSVTVATVPATIVTTHAVAIVAADSEIDLSEKTTTTCDSTSSKSDVAVGTVVYHCVEN